MNNDVVLAAIEYIKLGFSVIPIRPRGKAPEGSVLPRNAEGKPKWEIYQDRPPLIEEARQWFETRPSLNIAIVTGRISGIIVVDIDVHKGGDESFKTLVTETIRTAWVTTGRGFHGYFKYPRNCVLGNRVEVLKGIDIRSDGGLVNAPPSIHPNGKPYEWSKKLPQRSVLAELPNALLDLLLQKNDAILPTVRPKFEAKGDHAEIAATIFNHQCQCLQTAPNGERNHQLNMSTYTLARLAQTGVISESLVRDTMRSIALSIGLGENEIEATVNSAIKAGSQPQRAWIWHR